MIVFTVVAIIGGLTGANFLGIPIVLGGSILALSFGIITLNKKAAEQKTTWKLLTKCIT